MSDVPHVPSRFEIHELIAQSEALRAEARELMQHMEAIRTRIDVLLKYPATGDDRNVTGKPTE